ncbi:MAG: 4-hydroxybenzoate octaprenyltransferase [Bacteroidetes bacterium]|nr:MAG: 4-hydroxybenzoate octaprenyltransferase [Bacteroidota bacterium]
MSKVRSYLSLIKFSHTIFAMPFAMIGFFLGMSTGLFELNIKSANPGIDAETRDILYLGHGAKLFLLVILCMVFARSAAMAFNRYLDRSFDARNPRTAIREIPAGVLKTDKVLLFTIMNCIMFVACTFFINKICFYLSPVALLVVLGYSYTKRFTPLCHLILGLGLSLAPIGAYLAVTGQFALLPILFSFTVLFWVSGFDIIYALQDEEFDKENKLYSIPAALGKTRALTVSRILHLLSAACVVFAGWYGNFGLLYCFGAALFVCLLVYQHTLVKPTDLKKVNLAFFTTNGIASVVFAIFVIADLFFNN